MICLVYACMPDTHLVEVEHFCRNHRRTLNRCGRLPLNRGWKVACLCMQIKMGAAALLLHMRSDAFVFPNDQHVATVRGTFVFLPHSATCSGTAVVNLREYFDGR